MVPMRRRLTATVPVSVLAVVLPAGPASATTISWRTWNSGVVNATTGSASGTIGALAVSYTGEMRGFDLFLQWAPVSSFTGGTVDNAPPFGSFVTDPAIA